MPIPDFIVELRAKVGHTPLWLIGATAVVTRTVADSQQVLLVKRADSGRWAPVSGIVDPGEDPHVAAVREIREEASVEATVRRLTWVSVTDPVHYPNGDVSQYVDHTFACDWVSGEPAVGDEENTDAGWFPVDQLPAGMTNWHRERVEQALRAEPEVRLGR